jgi:two-component system, sensor histidine kinase ChiS
VEIARQISSAIRHSDVLVRWGGDEFLVVSRYTNREEAGILADRVLQAVGNGGFVTKSGERLRCTCSVGWAVFPWFVRDPEAVECDEVLRLADCALYEAKKAGKNQAIGMLPSCEKPLPASGNVTSGKEARLSEQLAARTVTTAGPPVSQFDSEDRKVAAKSVVAAQLL